MTSAEVLNEAFAALDKADYSKVASLLDRDFEFTGPTPKPIGAAEFIDFEKALHQAMPNIRHNAIVYSDEDGDWVRGEVQVSGTHKGMLDLPYISRVPATKKKVKLAKEKFVALVRDDKIVSFSADVGSEGGLIGILRQIGRGDLADCLRTGGIDCRLLGQTVPIGAHTY